MIKTENKKKNKLIHVLIYNIKQLCVVKIPALLTHCQKPVIMINSS